MNRDRIAAAMERIPVPFLFLLVIGYFSWDLYNFTKAEDSPLLQKRAEIESVEREVIQLQVKLKGLDVFRQQLEGKKTELRLLAQKLDDMRASISESFDDASFIRSVTGEAEKTRLDVRSISPSGAAINQKYYAEHKFDVAFKGVYFQLLLFMQRLASMQMIVTIESFDLRPTGTRLQKFNLLEGRMTIKGYNYLRDEADDIFKRGKGSG